MIAFKQACIARPAARETRLLFLPLRWASIAARVSTRAHIIDASALLGSSSRHVLKTPPAPACAARSWLRLVRNDQFGPVLTNRSRVA
ncbi:hypothetical protein AQJ54_42505 [Streptomyces griseorubiginosus]|uniref:Uncharacterized protein n=1 Tax=Streptomyces griseorubiginosus TaxID=67304 RepID=A0A101RMQ3_9ACTN|nr:hypothetical protein AQJ54_42505 [Streptomyces griseorubiginosus]